MTQPMHTALWIAAFSGGSVYAGFNVMRWGSKYTVSASSLRGLAARGMVALFITPDGGMGARVIRWTES